MKISLETIVKRATGQVSTEINEEVAILNLKNSQYYGLDAVGTAVWHTLSQPTAAIDICRAIADKFEVDGARCEADVLSLLRSLDEAGLIEIAAPSKG